MGGGAQLSDEDAMFEGKMAWELATEVQTVVECVEEGLLIDEQLEAKDTQE